MKKNSILPIVAVGALAYFLFKSQNGTANTYDSSGGFGGGGTNPGFIPETSFTSSGARAPSAYTVSSTSPTGQLRTTQISSVQQGVDFINQNYGSLQPTGQTLLRTGSNSTISKLGTGQVVSLKVNPVSESKSFFAKPIKVIKGKRTRNY